MRREFYDLLAGVYEEKYSDSLNRKMRRKNCFLDI